MLETLAVKPGLNSARSVNTEHRFSHEQEFCFGNLRESCMSVLIRAQMIIWHRILEMTVWSGYT